MFGVVTKGQPIFLCTHTSCTDAWWCQSHNFSFNLQYSALYWWHTGIQCYCSSLVYDMKSLFTWQKFYKLCFTYFCCCSTWFLTTFYDLYWCCVRGLKIALYCFLHRFFFLYSDSLIANKKVNQTYLQILSIILCGELIILRLRIFCWSLSAVFFMYNECLMQLLLDQYPTTYSLYCVLYEV